MVDNKDLFPCILNPLTNINDIDDPKAKRQEAIYIFQTDLKHPINRYLPVEKIKIKKNFTLT